MENKQKNIQHVRMIMIFLWMLRKLIVRHFFSEVRVGETLDESQAIDMYTCNAV